jgi:Amt family ammonium transporter
MKYKFISSMVGVGALLLTSTAGASVAEQGQSGYLFNTLFLFFSAVLVMFMAAGFTMLEAGMVRSKSVATICAKNISLYAISGIVFYLLGYQLMYGPSYLGLAGDWATWYADDQAAIGGDYSAGSSAGVTWFFQMVFVATAASVVSGALAERVRFWPFIIFVAVLTGIIYPLVGHWTWGGGWLSELGFSDFAGSTVVHSVGGCAALIGAVFIGSRRGRFNADGSVHDMPPSSAPLVTLGTIILWFGWFGFNGGSQLAFSSAEDAIAVSTILVNTNLAAAGGVVAMLLASHIISRRVDLLLILNGALAGLVSITAEPVTPTGWQAMLIGAIGALLMLAGSKALHKLQIDDVVDAIPVHLIAGVWGTLAVVLTNPGATIGAQAIGVVAIIGFVSISSIIVWGILKFVTGVRLNIEHENRGADLTETGLRAYNLT